MHQVLTQIRIYPENEGQDWLIHHSRCESRNSVGAGLEKLGIGGIQDTGQFAFSWTNEAGPVAPRLDRTRSNVYICHTKFKQSYCNKAISFRV